MTAPISRGSSGSPVINMNGKVVGVATFKFASGQNLNFAIPADNILAMEDFKPLEVAAWSEKVSEDKNETLASLQKDIIKHIKHEKSDDKIEESKNIWLPILQKSFPAYMGLDFVANKAEAAPTTNHQEKPKPPQPQTISPQPQKTAQNYYKKTSFTKKASSRPKIVETFVDISNKDAWPKAHLITKFCTAGMFPETTTNSTV